MKNTEICPVCGITKENGNFFFSHALTKPNPVATPPDEVYSKVCQFAKKSGCINVGASVDETLTYASTLPEWEATTKFYLKQEDNLEPLDQVD